MAKVDYMGRPVRGTNPNALPMGSAQQPYTPAAMPVGGSPWGGPSMGGSSTFGGAPVTNTTYANPTAGTTSTGNAAGGNANSAAAIKYLNQVLKGKQLPYDKETQANMLSEQSGMASAGEAARNAEMNQSAVAGGASYNDPSLAGARASSMARRQSENMGAAREIAQNASIQNQAQKMAAAKALATFGLAESDRMAQWQQAMLGQPNSQQMANQNAGSFTDGSFNQGGGQNVAASVTPSAQASHLGYSGGSGYSTPTLTGGGTINPNLLQTNSSMFPPTTKRAMPKPRLY